MGGINRGGDRGRESGHRRKPYRRVAVTRRGGWTGTRAASGRSARPHARACTPELGAGSAWPKTVPAHLEEHTTFDLSLGKAIAENLTVSVTALNLANRRFLLDNSQTFGGTHYADPRQIWVAVRYRFRY